MMMAKALSPRTHTQAHILDSKPSKYYYSIRKVFTPHSESVKSIYKFRTHYCYCPNESELHFDENIAGKRLNYRSGFKLAVLVATYSFQWLFFMV